MGFCEGVISVNGTCESVIAVTGIRGAVIAVIGIRGAVIAVILALVIMVQRTLVAIRILALLAIVKNAVTVPAHNIA